LEIRPEKQLQIERSLYRPAAGAARPRGSPVDVKDWRSDAVEAIKQLEAIERSASVSLAWLVTLLEKQRKLVGAIARVLELLRALSGQGAVRPPNERSSHGARSHRRFVLGGHGLTLSPLLSALLAALAPGTWQTAAALTDGVHTATGRRPTRRALVQGISRLRRALLAAGVKFRIEHRSLLGWRLGIKVSNESDT